MKISIVIPNYNGESLLQKNLLKVANVVFDYKEGEIEMIIVDDGSKDSSVNVVNILLKTELKEWREKIKVIKNEKNLGFSSAVNNGVKQAKGEIIVLLNTDVTPEKGFLGPLLKNFNDPLLFAAGCLDKSIEGEKMILRGRGIGKWQRGFLIHARGEVDKRDTLWVSGGSGAFRKAIWEKLGGLDEVYNPFYWEDIDLSYRALKSGYKILFEPQSIVIHEHEKGIIRSKYSQEKIKITAYRNQFIFVWKNVTDKSLLLSHFYWLPYHFLKTTFSIDMAFSKGFFEALGLLPRILKLRSQSQRRFVKKDREVTQNY